ncbi:winged helix-turn-helix domain-containing protein [Salininema proteolyticum]|uniref:Winged helix-turn-helix domain-containing protein n=1 Tax=Salininema proteolyticum TaxID=1607685 RepID=A0ABV8TZI8_9ACTN
MAHILLVEDDSSVRKALSRGLALYGHEVDTAATGQEGLAKAAGAELVVLDIMLPGMSGFEVCRSLRASGQTPIVMLTALSDDLDVVGGLEAGADDYVVKPVEPRVLDARVRAILRRGAPAGGGVLQRGALELDSGSLTVSKHSRPIALTPTETRLLFHLASHPEQVFTRQQLLEAVWEHDFLGDSRLVDNGVQRLRAKVEDDPASPRYVQTVRGFGYRFGPF